ncbi:hypothetical protein KY285_027146 [Solanum tuberosum]|nr:hypothetical protein KY285_027146 [Solanum tuberosum]
MGTTRPETILTLGNTSIVNTQPSQLMAIDAHHPYFLHNSDSPRMNLVNVTFDGKGLPGWRRSMLIALSAKKKLRFINETCATPDPQTPQYGQRSCYNDIVYHGKSKLVKSLEDQRLIQFLLGLNDVYPQARGNILMMNPLPSIDYGYSLLLQDEN